MLGRIFKTILVSGALLCVAVHAAIDEATKEVPHSDPFRSCVSAECHAPVVQHKYLHGPLVIGQCTVCHAPLPGPEHKFRILQEGAALCGVCHRPVDTEKFIHDPVAEGRCLECHEPHGSAEPSQIRISPLAKLCNDCHDPVATKKHIHDPVAKGECLSCHPAHGSKEPKLLNASGRSLCFECHEEMKPAAAGSREIHLAKEDCAGCHLPHESDYANLLTKPPLELCFGCHEDLKQRMQSDEFRHEAVTEGQACSECHRAHTSTLSALLREPAGDLCYSCHEELKARVDASKFRHQPVEDQTCGSCHLPHSSRYANLLLAESPAGSYAPYDPERYALCFSCHEEALAGERYTETFTDFRNGALNLHYLHVNKEVNGRTCLTCHDAHMSNQPRLIRNEAPYRSWRVPIGFVKTDTGGSCSSGCHEELAYDRVHPIQLKAE
jgi:predicted CXXCH cytochrome family protein